MLSCYLLIFSQTKPETLSKECQASLPKKEEKKQKKLTKEERLKADRRKKIRNKAAKMARGDLQERSVGKFFRKILQEHSVGYFFIISLFIFYHTVIQFFSHFLFLISSFYFLFCKSPPFNMINWSISFFVFLEDNRVDSIIIFFSFPFEVDYNTHTLRLKYCEKYNNEKS